MSNAEVLIQLERLIQEVQSGKLTIDFVLNKGRVKGLSVFGRKKLLYNRSQVDQQTNEKAAEDVIRRMLEATNRGEHENLDFSVKIAGGRVQFVEWQSKQQKTFDSP